MVDGRRCRRRAGVLHDAPRFQATFECGASLRRCHSRQSSTPAQRADKLSGRLMSHGRQPGPGDWSRIHLIVTEINSGVERLRGEGVTFRHDVLKGPGESQVLIEDSPTTPSTCSTGWAMLHKAVPMRSLPRGSSGCIPSTLALAMVTVRIARGEERTAAASGSDGGAGPGELRCVASSRRNHGVFQQESVWT
jgi:hypothetical protein